MKKLILISLIALFSALQTQAQGTFEVDERTVYSIAEYTTAANTEWIFTCGDAYIINAGLTWADADDTDATFEMWFSYDGGTTWAQSTIGAKTLNAASGHKVLREINMIDCDAMKIVYTNNSNSAITLTLNIRFTSYKDAP